MKKTILKSFFVLVLAISFTNCNDEVRKPDGNDVDDGTVTFTGSVEDAEWNTKYVTVQIEWSETKWKLSTQDKMFESFSDTLGGDWTGEGYIDVKVYLKPNGSNTERTGEISVLNYSTRESFKINIKQGFTTDIGTQLTFDLNTKYQKVTGFGGMLNPTWTGSSQLTEAEIEKLYSADGLGYNIIRMMVYPNSGSWDTNTAIAKKAQSLGAIVFGTPWTPPSNMKSNGTNTNADGGYLLPAKYADYASHLKSFVDYQKSQGLNLYAISVQNEPDWKVDYDGCSWTPDQMNNFVKNHGRAVGTKLIAGETVNNRNKNYTNMIMNDAVSVNNFDIVATHLYGGGIAKDLLAQQHGKEFWMTEHLFNETNKDEGFPEWNWTWEPSLDTMGKEIHDCMEADFNAYVWWYLKRYYSMVGENDAEGRSPVAEGEITKRGYIMGHYAKYATGRTRVKNELVSTVEFEEDIWVTTYHGEKDLTIVLINTNNDAFMLKLESPSAVKSVSAVETTENKNMEEIDFDIRDDKKSIVLGISAKSIVSVKIDLD